MGLVRAIGVEAQIPICIHPAIDAARGIGLGVATALVVRLGHR
jgi:hypothetical protein